jgi:glucose-6-phosphate isomerase
MSLYQTKAGKELLSHHKKIAHKNMQQLFKEDSSRFEECSLQMPHLFVDYSKNRFTKDTLTLLINLAKEMELPKRIEDMFQGIAINTTENRAALHTALRDSSHTPIIVNRENIAPRITATLNKMKTFSDSVRDGTWKGFTGKSISDIVNIGIGGSDLGPKMVCRALSFYRKTHLTIHFVSNVDGTQISETLAKLDPETTLFCIASKTFTTLETLMNANTAREWLLKASKDPSAIAKHFIAISANPKEAQIFGVQANNIFEFWDFVGGRYSVWSAIGLPIMLLIGASQFAEFLAGAHDMDQHFRETPFEKNGPVILGLLDVWYRNFFHTASQAIMAYDQYLEHFYPYLQQLEMESDGKSMQINQTPTEYATSPVIWGGLGTDKQHAFYQLLHQGTDLIPTDFIIALHPLHHLAHHHEYLVASCFAQSQALLIGKTKDTVKKELEEAGVSSEVIKKLTPHKIMPGNRPSNTLLLDILTPQSLGALIAFYEHRVFTAGTLWNINSFDQWGVELGKQLSKKITPHLKEKNHTTDTIDFDGSTQGLISKYIDR